MTQFATAPIPEAARTLPGWALRTVLGAATVGAITVAMIGAPQIGATSVVGVLLALGAIGTVVVPGTVLPLVVLICLVLYRLAAVDTALDGALLALIALLPLVHQLAGICAAIPPRSACHWAALRPALSRYLIAVVPVELVVALVIVAG